MKTLSLSLIADLSRLTKMMLSIVGASLLFIFAPTASAQDSNTAYGDGALANNTSGINNSAFGEFALNFNKRGSDNCAFGAAALDGNLDGSYNVAVGVNALASPGHASNNIGIGFNALVSDLHGSNNIAIGSNAGQGIVNGSNNVIIANNGGRESGAIRIGIVGTQTNTYIAGISGVTVAGGVSVLVDSQGHLGTMTSSARYKDQIKPMAKSSEAILSLKPMTFRYKKELDPDAIPQFGLVAEDVAKVDPDLVAKDKEGKPYTVRYEAVNAMLLNEFLKEHKRAEEQAKKMEAQASKIEQLETALEKMNARLDAKGL